MSKKLMLLIALIVAVLGGAAFYFLYWVRMPAYSIYLAYDAAKAHDVTTFERYVDMKSVYTYAFDAVSDKILNKERSISGIGAAVRDEVVDRLVEKTRASIANDGSKAAPAPAPSEKQSPKQDIIDLLNLREISQEYIQKYMDQRLNFKYMRLKDVSNSEKVDGHIIVTGKFHDIQVDKDFKLKLRMKELEDGKWQVVEIVNVVDIIIERDKAVQNRLAELNKEIQAKMNGIFSVKNVKADAKTLRKGLLPVVEFAYTIDYCLADNKNQAQQVMGTYLLHDANGKQNQKEYITITDLASKYTAADFSTKKVYQYSWTKRDSLGVLIGHERGIMKKGIQNYKASFIVDKIILKDGTEMGSIDVLPEPK